MPIFFNPQIMTSSLIMYPENLTSCQIPALPTLDSQASMFPILNSDRP